MSLGNVVLPLVSAGSALMGGTTLSMQIHGYGPRYWMISDPNLRAAYHASVLARRGWKPLMAHLRLCLDDRIPRRRDMRGGHTRREGNPKLITPKLSDVTYDPYGFSATATLIPRVKLKHFLDVAEDLANHWGMVRVSAAQPKANTVKIRAVLRDPLTDPYDFVPTGRAPEDLRYYPAGFDGFGERARIRLRNGSGICVFGLPRSGKTSFILGLMSWLAPSDRVVFLIADGKTSTGYEGDYMDIAPRAHSVIGSDPYRFNAWLKQIEKIREMRAATIRQSLGVRSLWDIGPTPEWPLIMPIIDECHVFFEQFTASGNWQIQERNGVIAENTYLASNIVRMGPAVGVLPVIATQKGTGEPCPTIIRDNCHEHVCFQVKTDEAAKAALGKEILKYPDQNPANFQSEEFVGVATKPAEGRRGFIQVRTPHCSAETVAAVAEATAHLVRPEVCPGLDIGLDHHALLAADDAAALLAGGYPNRDELRDL